MRECLEHIYRRVNGNPSMSEDELYGVLINSKFFRKLGYKKFGKDVRAQRVVPGKRKKADYVCRDEYQNAVFVLEAKRPSYRTLSDALSQLWDRYVLPLKARYGVLTNGWKFVVYKKIGENSERVLTVDLSKISQKRCDELFRILRKPEYDVTLYSRVEEYFSSVEKLSLKTELAKEDFFETFKLEEDSVFGSLLTSLVELFDFVYPKSKFLKGAYGFWQRSLARKPKKIPDSWAPFLKEKRDVFRFMFCLESAHALLARLIVAKACEDLDFPGISVSGFTLRKIHQVRGQIPLVAYPLVLISVIREMRDQLVYSLFEDDIFGWWRDGFTELMQKSSSELLRESVDNRLENFSEAVAKVIFMLYKFDFREVAGDPLGDLYQKYFDKDTRKALGEFYTPVEVVNYILDAVGYKNIGSNRLLDPACGSGTFIVEALKRYLREAKGKAKKHGWAYVLRELCNSPKIVGFDIHPFACLIARTRFMLELIPCFKKALEEEAPRIFYLRRIPIFRTDSLAIEMLPPEFQRQRQLTETKEDITFPVTLPMKINSESSISANIILPSWGKILSYSLTLYNLDEYFCTLQAMFDAVKKLLEVEAEHVPETSLRAYLQEYLENKDFEQLANFFKPYADHMLNEIKRIRSEFGNGRLIKSIEDRVLASLLKGYLRYDFVVGNPPYVRVQRLDRDMKRSYHAHYASAKGKFDIYVIFIERGLQWVNERGRLGFITSNKFTQANYGKGIRSYLVGNCCIDEFIDFGDSGVFADVTNYPCIFVLSKGKEVKSFPYVRVKTPAENILDHIRIHLDEKDFLDSHIHVFRVDSSHLDEDAWDFNPEVVTHTLDKIMNQANCRLKDVCRGIRKGIGTAADKVFIVPKNVALKLENDLLRPIVKGEDVRKWRVTWKGMYIIYPHFKKRGRIYPVNLSSFPRVKDYLEKHREDLEKRTYVIESGKKWYEIWNPRNPAYFEDCPKIITPDVSTGSNFVLDHSRYYCHQTCYVINVKMEKIEPIYLLGILNSKLSEFYVKAVSPFISGGYYRYLTQYLEGIPVRLPETSEEGQLADQIVEKVKSILQQIEPHRLIEKFPETYINEYRLKGEEFDEIDYTFSAGHTGLKPFLSGLPSKGYVVYPSEDEDFIWVDTKEKAQYLALALRNRTVKQNATIEILVPRDNLIVTEILERVKKTIQKIKATPIDQLEEEINELVYELYGLNEDDKAIIENFRKKF